MITCVKHFNNLWDAWEFCNKYKKYNPILIEKSYKGLRKVNKDIKVIIQLKKRK